MYHLMGLVENFENMHNFMENLWREFEIVVEISLALLAIIPSVT